MAQVELVSGTAVEVAAGKVTVVKVRMTSQGGGPPVPTVVLDVPEDKPKKTAPPKPTAPTKFD